MALGDPDDVDHLVLAKDLAHRHLLLEVRPGEVNLVSHGAAVQLNLHDVRLLLPEDIRVTNDHEKSNKCQTTV